MTNARRRPVRFTLDLSPPLHRALRRYALDNDIHASDVVRQLLGDFLEAQVAGDKAVEAAIFRRGIEAGVARERERIAEAIQPLQTDRPGLPTKPPVPRDPTGTAGPGAGLGG